MRLLPFEYAARSLGRRPLRTALGMLGSVLVVLLVMLSAAFVRGMGQSMSVTALPENVMLLSAGSEESIERSQIDPRVAEIATASIPGIESRLGTAYVSPEIHSALTVRTQPEGEGGELTVVRGVGPRAFLVHPQVQIAVGAAPRAGMDEILIGGLVAEQMGLGEGGLTVGDTLWVGGREWTISGIGSAPRTVMDGEVWMPLSDLQILTRRSSLSCVVMTMADGDGLADAEVFASTRLDLEVTAMGEAAYYREMNAFLAPVRTMIVATTLLIAIGGLLGGLNTMYAAFASRVREIAALQVVGFRRLPIAISLVQESLLLNLVGTVVGVSLGLVLLSGISIRLSMGSFGLVLDGPVVAIAIGTGLLLAVVGAIPPVWRCLRLPISEALRSA